MILKTLSEWHDIIVELCRNRMGGERLNNLVMKVILNKRIFVT